MVAAARPPAALARLLGPPVVECEGRTYPLRAERRQQLLAWLALHGGALDRDRIAALFWPERDNATARRNLRKLAFDAQSLDWSGGLESDRATLRWAPDTDVAAFERALAAGRVEEAVALYRGPLCDGLEGAEGGAFAAALHRERRRFAERWRNAALALARRPATAPSEALSLAQALLRADSFDEEALAVSLRAYAAEGRGAEAARLYREFKERLAASLGVEPAAPLRELARTFDAAPPAPARDVPGAAPPATAFVGRTGELQELLALLARDECRVLCVTGAGGVGKSRFAKAALTHLGSGFRDRTWWIPLDDLTEAPQVGPRVAQLLGIALAGAGDPLDAVGAFCASRHLLLVLDNAEQVQGLAALVDVLVARAPQLKVLVTSRHRLGAAGEWVLPLAGLPAPAAGDPWQAAALDSVRLFDLRARAAQPAFNLDREIDAVARLVHRLGGLPLAIELAAHWVRLLPVTEIEKEVASSLDILERADDGDERPEHRSVRATFEQSWRWLAPREQATLAALSVFVGPFSRAAAREVADASLPVLAALADKSLVQPTANARFAFHPLVREFAREKLAGNGADLDDARAKHAAYFVHFLAGCADFRRVDQKTALDDIERELEDCVAAWRWATEHRDVAGIVQAARPLRHFLANRGRAGEAIGLFEAPLQAFDQSVAAHLPALAECAVAVAHAQVDAGRYAQAEETGRRALRWARSGARRGLRADALLAIGRAIWEQGRIEESRRYFEQCLKLAQAEDETGTSAAALGSLAGVDQVLGNYEAAVASCREQLALRRSAGTPLELANSLQRLGDLLRSMDRFEEALPWLHEGLALSEQHGLRRNRLAFELELGLTFCELGQNALAQDYTGRALADARELQSAKLEIISLEVLARLATARGDPAAARRWLGDAMRLETAIGNVPLQLETASIYAEAIAAEGNVQRAAAMWSFVAAHEMADSQNRRRAREMRAALTLDEKALAQAEREGERLRVEMLAAEVMNAGASAAG